MTASIGITSFPEDASEPELLIKYADTAMYQAKQKGRDTYCTFTPQMNVELLKQLSLEAALRKAIENEQFVVHYQPKVDMQTGRITGLEALLRWQRPGHGLVPPLYFISVLEESGLIVAGRELGDRDGVPADQEVVTVLRSGHGRYRSTCRVASSSTMTLTLMSARALQRERDRPFAARARTDRELPDAEHRSHHRDPAGPQEPGR